MRIVFVIIALILFVFVAGHHAQSVETSDDMDIGQSTRGSGMTTPRPTTAPTTPPTRTPTIPSTPSTRPTRRPSRPTRRPLMTWREMMPDMGMGMGMGMSRDEIRLMKRESRMLMKVFRTLLELRLRALMDMPRQMPLTRWEKKMIRMMALSDMLMTMEKEGDETAQLAEMMQEQDMDNIPMDEAATEHETEAEPQVEHEEEIAEMDQQDDDATLIETEFDIAEPYGYGGYGGYGGKKGGYGGGKKSFGFNFGLGKKGGFGFGFNKKAPFKKVPFKKGGYGGYY